MAYIDVAKLGQQAVCYLYSLCGIYLKNINARVSKVKISGFRMTFRDFWRSKLNCF